jgi:hypothetical protein
MESARADNFVARQVAKTHHDHCIDAAKGYTKPGTQQSVLAEDADCGTCHSGCSAVVPTDLSVTVTGPNRILNTAHLCAWAARVNPPPEKPQWSALV